MLREPLVLVALAGAASAQTNLHTFRGAEEGDGLGSAIVDAGDVDQDLVRDFAIGVPGEGPSGTVRVVSGASGATIRSLHSPASSGQFGFHLANVGDVDLDGIDDLAVGDTAEAGPSGAGSVRVFSGADGSLLYALFGSSTPSFFGQTIAGAGDVDGDGAADLIVGAVTDTSLGGLGTARLYSGATGTELHAFTGEPGTGYGYAVVGLGDVDGDLVPDVGASWLAHSSVNGVNAGRVTVFSGATFAPIYHVLGPHAGATIGSSLARIDDVDGDGVDDLLIGAEGLAGTPVTGAAYLHSGAGGALLHSFPGDSNGDRFGCSTADAGDLDGDGVSDLLVGARVGNYAKAYSGASGAWLFTLRETNTGWMTPIAVAGLDDLDGDGRGEIAIGSSTDSTNGQFSGRLRVVSDGATPLASVGSCSGDGSAGPCPCGNAGASGAGCANSTGSGAALAAYGTTSVADDLLFLEGQGLPPSVLTVLFAGTSSSPTALAPAGAGLRCIGGTLKRVAVRSSNQAGRVWLGPTLQPLGGWNAGETRHFQAFYRNPTGPCGQVFNVSGAASVTFAP